MSKIAPLTPADLPDLLALQRLAFRTEAPLYPGAHIPALEEGLDDLRGDCVSRTVLGVREDGRLIGSVRGHVANGVGHIERLVVHPDARGRGLARQLMAAIEAALGTPTLQLFTGARSDGNLHLYAALGYTESGTSERGGIPFVHLRKERVATSVGC